MALDNPAAAVLSALGILGLGLIIWYMNFSARARIGAQYGLDCRIRRLARQDEETWTGGPWTGANMILFGRKGNIGCSK